MKHKIRAALGVMISVIALSIAAAVPASAKPLEHEHFVEAGSELVQEVDPLFCAGIVDFPVLHEWTVEEKSLVVVRGDGLAYGGGPVRATDTWTNTLNGETLTVTFVGKARDHRVTDNGDGTLTIEVAVSGIQKVSGPDGKALLLETGLFKFAVLVDHSGTPSDPFDDEFIMDLGLTARHGQTDTMGRDFCEDLVLFIG